MYLIFMILIDSNIICC